MKNEIIGTLCVMGVVAVIGFVLFDNTIPSEEQKPRMQDVKTEIMTHVIRCTAFVNDTCTEYKVYSVIKE